MPLLVITGGTKGIGRAIAQRFAAEGYDIATCARTAEDLTRMSEEIGQKYGVSVYTSVADLAEKSQAMGFVSFVKQLKRNVDVLVNNAGSFAFGPFLEEGNGLMEEMMASNYYSAYWVTRGLLPDMIEQEGGGHLFNICSIGSITHKTGGGSYFVAKQALYGFTKNLQEDIRGKGVKVTAVLPSATHSSSWEGSGVDPGRLMDPNDIAESVWHCLSLSERSQIEELVLRPPLGDL